MCGDVQRGEDMQPWSWLASCNVSDHPHAVYRFLLMAAQMGCIALCLLHGDAQHHCRLLGGNVWQGCV